MPYKIHYSFLQDYPSKSQGACGSQLSNIILRSWLLFNFQTFAHDLKNILV